MFAFLPKRGRYPALTALLLLGSASAWAQTVDGTRDGSYPTALAVQTVNTGFGDNNVGSSSFANGSELDNIHAQIVGSNLYLFIGGNLESSFNKLDLFFDSQAGGQNQLSGNTNYLSTFNGMKFDAGFTADYALSVTCGNNPLEVYTNYTPVPGTGADFTGGGVGNTRTILFSNVTMGASNGTVSIDNSNTAGVGSGTGAANNAAATAVSTGIEYKIPLDALGTSAYGGHIKIIAFINNSSWNYLSNQVLAGLPAGTGNLGGDNNGNFTGNLSGVDFSAKAGNQYVTVLNAPPTIDGSLDGIYPTALAVQTVETQFGDNNLGSQTLANGSELDNIRGQVIGSDLYLFIGGNLESNFNKLDLFFDSKPGGQNTLTGNGFYVGNMNGLKFDAGFAADYALSITCGNNPLELYTNYAPVPTGAITGDFSGGGVGRTQTINFSSVVTGAGSGQVSIDNSNTAGVSGGTAAANQPAAAAVATGMEYRIPLSALGTIATGGDIKIIAFINNGGWNFLSNQVLAGLPAGTSNLGGPSGVDFTSYTGNQFVTVANGGVAAQPEIDVAPQTLNFYNVSTAGGTVNRTVTVTNNGNATLNVTNISSNNAAFTPSVTSLSVAPSSSQPVTITFDPSAAGVNNATISFTSDDPNNPTENITATGKGIAPGNVVVDGTVDASLYGSAMVLQTTPTGFGNSNTGQPGSANGSELDGAYATIQGGFLYLMLTGNLETNNNKLVVFFDTDVPNGQQTFSASNPSVDFGNSNNMAGLTFDAGFRPEYFLSLNQGGANVFANFAAMDGSGGNGQYLTPSVNDLTSPLDFGGGIFGEVSINNSNTGGVSGATVGTPGAVTTGIELKIPLSMIGATGSGTPIRVMAMIANQNYNFLSNQFLGGLPNGTANLGSPSGKDLGANYLGQQFFTAKRGNVTISNAQPLSGNFNDVTVASGGLLDVAEAFDVSGTMLVQNGGELSFVDATSGLTGSDFVLQAGGSLVVRSPQGISASGTSGDIKTTTRSFSTDAIYTYFDGGVTGNGLPATVRELHVLPLPARPMGTSGATLSQDLSVSELVDLQADLLLNGNALRLLSSGGGTALINNNGGVVVGSTGEMECHLDASFTGAGYRHYSTPTAGMTVGDMSNTAVGGFAPVVNPAYNTAPNPFFPGAVLPFPNVFYFDETNATTNFVLGYRSPNSLADPLQIARGYSVQITGSPEIIFTGTFTNGNQSIGVTKTGATANSGFNLLGNPYPSPIDWDNVTIPAGMANQVSVFRPAASPSRNGGSYLTYTNGVGSLPGGLVAAMQGIFVRRSAAGSGTFPFTNAARVTTFDPTIVHYRTTTDMRPLVRLDVLGTGTQTGLSDAAFVYFEAGATDGLDDVYDALRVSHSTGSSPTISTLLAGNLETQIDGRPVLTQPLNIPLLVEVGATGTYQLHASELRNFAPGQPVLLQDALTGTVQDLTQNPVYSFAMDASFRGPRFTLHFGAGRVTGLNPNAAAAQLSVYPNPSAGTCTVEWAGTQPLTGVVVLTDLMGREVSRLSAADRLTLTNLPKGVYTLRVTSATGPLTRRVVVE